MLSRRLLILRVPLTVRQTKQRCGNAEVRSPYDILEKALEADHLNNEANCQAPTNSDFVPTGSGGDGASVQFCKSFTIACETS